MAFDWSQLGIPLQGLGTGLMSAGAGGWQQFGPGYAVGAGLGQRQLEYKDQKKIRDLQAVEMQQQIEQQRAANTEKAQRAAALQAYIASQGGQGGMMAPGGASGQPPQPGAQQLPPGMMQGGGAPSGQFSPEQLQFLQAAGPDTAMPIIGQQLFPPPDKAPTPMNVGGMIIDPRHPDQVLADDSDVIGKNAQASANQTTVNLPKIESAYQTKFGGAQGEKAALISTEGDTARKQLDSLSTIEALRGAAVAAGGDVSALAPIKMKAGAMLQAVGLDPKDYDLGPTGILQAIDSAANKLALSGIGQGGLPANNFSEADRNFIVSTVPSLADTPQGFQLKSLVLKKANARTLEKEAMWNSGKYDQTTEAGYQQFITDWSKHVQTHPLFSDAERNAAEQLKSAKPSVVKTLPPGFQ